MSVSTIIARYAPPQSVYAAEIKASSKLGFAITRTALASRAFDAKDADGDLRLAEEFLTEVLGAVLAARADLRAELDAPAHAPNVASLDDYPKSFTSIGEAGERALRRLVPRQPALHSSGFSAGTTTPAPTGKAYGIHSDAAE